MLSYLLKVTLGWAVCYLVFHFLLRRETFFKLNRWYLLIMAFVCLVVPVLEMPTWTDSENMTPVVQYLQPVTIGVEQLEAVIITASAKKTNVDWWKVLSGIYLLGVVLAFAKFGYGLWQIFNLYKRSESSKGKGYRFVSTNADHVPFSFFNHLFWSKQFEVEPTDRAAIIRHEEAHIFQKHSIDVILMELLCVFFWFSPPIYLFKKAVKTNHEYLADEAVLQKTTRKNYGRLLLKQFQPSPTMALSNSLFSSQLKNRIVMMTKTKSTRMAALKYLAGLPLLALLIMAFSFSEKPKNKLENEKAELLISNDTTPDADVYKVVDEMPRFPGCEDLKDGEEKKSCWQKKMLEFIYTNVKYPEQARKRGVDGIVVISFIVEKDGSITGAKIKRSIGAGCDEEVLKVVDKMPNWIPGKQNGEAVRVKFHLPVRFKIEGSGICEMDDVDEMPLFLEGCENAEKELKKECAKKALFGFIGQNLKYPKSAKDQGIEGMAIAEFTIAENGSLTNPIILKSLDSACDAEVLRVLESMPKWTPGMKNGKPIAVKMKLPFKFALPQDGVKYGKSDKLKTHVSKVELFKVFPNPATNNVKVKLKADKGVYYVTIVDASGKQLGSIKVLSDGVEQLINIETSDMPKGKAFVMLVGEDSESLEVASIVLQ